MNVLSDEVKKELEFDRIQAMLANYANGDRAKRKFYDIRPISNIHKLEFHLNCLEEYIMLKSDSTMPGLVYEDLADVLRMLRVEGTVLQKEQLFKVYDVSVYVNTVFRFFKQNDYSIPNFLKLFEDLLPTKVIVKMMDNVYDYQRMMKPNASPELYRIKQQLVSKRKVADRNFESEMARCHKEGWLAETREAFLNDTRLLSVLAEHKRKVKGKIRGTSKTSSISYIEPELNVSTNNDIHVLIDDEKEEIKRIEKELTDAFRVEQELIYNYSALVDRLDFLDAKAKLAFSINAVKPKLTRKKHSTILEAVHPLLFLSNKIKKLPTNSQDIELNENQRVVVISGPNAGGKSLSLKTFGLLQIMIQCGLFVSVHPDSSFCLYRKFFTDIGDNQSIENELSTYSYRLNKMKEILKEADAQTFFLIDEFGTGSDPILGGALAEVFFKELAMSGAFGVLTTHYGNIKLMAEELEMTINACMLFDERRLRPLYKLSVGQPGSSYTFEVAKNVGIPEELVKEARSKLEGGNVKYEDSISKFQKLNNKLSIQEKELRKKNSKVSNLRKNLSERIDRLEDKELKQMELIETNNRHLSLGKKLEKIIEDYKKSKSRKTALARFRKLLEIEANYVDTEPDTPKKASKVLKESYRKYNFKEGDHVKLVSGREIGTVVEVNKERITVLFGIIKTSVESSKLMPADTKKQ